MIKKVLFTTCLIIMAMVVCSNLNAQNGGQVNENPSLKIEYAGTTGSNVSSLTIIKITNKQNCIADIQTKAGDIEITKQIPPLSSDTVMIHLPNNSNVKVQSKAITNCGTTDYGQVELRIDLSFLPVKFITIKTKIVK